MKLVDEREIKDAVTLPPKDTRASLRGYLIANHSSDILSIGWDYVSFKDGSYARMNNPLGFSVKATDLSDGAAFILKRAQEECQRRLADA